jgi:hypothetical protein
MAPVRWREAESATDTMLLVPLNDRAPPNFPEAVHVALAIVPLFPFPDESPSVLPLPSLNPYAATRVFEEETVTLTPADAGPRFPLSSTARALMTTVPE